jgi:hypothetical protein
MLSNAALMLSLSRQARCSSVCLLMHRSSNDGQLAAPRNPPPKPSDIYKANGSGQQCSQHIIGDDGQQQVATRRGSPTKWCLAQAVNPQPSPQPRCFTRLCAQHERCERRTLVSLATPLYRDSIASDTRNSGNPELQLHTVMCLHGAG